MVKGVSATSASHKTTFGDFLSNVRPTLDDDAHAIEDVVVGSLLRCRRLPGARSDHFRE